MSYSYEDKAIKMANWFSVTCLDVLVRARVRATGTVDLHSNAASGLIHTFLVGAIQEMRSCATFMVDSNNVDGCGQPT